MFDPKLGGSYEVFNARPLPQVLIEYCVGDVEFLPLLSTIYQSRLDSPWLERVRIETEKRLEESRSPSYQPHGKQKSLGPKKWRYPPKEGKKSGSTATVKTSSFKKAPKSFVTAATSAPKEEEKPTAIIAVSVPTKGKKPIAAVGGAAPKTKGKSTAGVGGSASKKKGRPTAAPTPKKGGKSTETAATPASEKGKKPIAAIAAHVSKKEKKSTAVIVASATSSVPAQLASQEGFIRPTVSEVYVFELSSY